MKAILLDEAKKWLEENCENQYTRVAVFGIMQSMPAVDYQETSNELTCEGCIHEYNEHENCNYCKRALYLGDYYCCRPPEEIGNYAYPPAHINREAWKPCEQCKPKCRICANCSILGKCGEPQVCVDCKDYSNFYSDYNYCANCGRPMTEEAWNVIERRLQYGETH